MITEIALPTTRIGMTPINIIENIPIMLKCQLIQTAYDRIDALYLTMTNQSKQQSQRICITINDILFKLYDKGEL